MADVMEVNEDNFEAQVEKAAQPALVDFWAPWCGPCRMMHPIIESLAGEFEGKAVIARCNVDENGALAQRFGVTAIPTLIMFKDGEKVDSMVGVAPEETIKQRLESQL